MTTSREIRITKALSAGFTVGEVTAAGIHHVAFGVHDATAATLKAGGEFSTGFGAGFGSKWAELSAQREAKLAAKAAGVASLPTLSVAAPTVVAAPVDATPVMA